MLNRSDESEGQLALAVSDQIVSVLADKLSAALGVRDLALLLQFVPPVELKHEADRLAREATALVVTGKEAVEAGDALIGKLTAAITEIDNGFDEPVSLAHQLHKRMTGLRADFRAEAAKALATVKVLVRDEAARLEDLAQAAAKSLQAAADKDARRDARAAVEEAKAGGASPAELKDLRSMARTATAPPVASPLAAPTRRATIDVEKWKARFRGTPKGAEPNPEMSELTTEQQALVCELMHAAADRKPGTKLVYFSINWAEINRDAHAQKSTFQCPTLEAFNQGVTKTVPQKR